MTEGQRELAVRMFNATWDLIDTSVRTPEQDRQMLTMACASRQLWDEIGGPTELVTGDWLVAHVASKLGHASLALDFAVAANARASVSDLPKWLLASTCEGLARAHAAADHATERDVWIERAKQLLEEVDDDEDRALIESQIASIDR